MSHGTLRGRRVVIADDDEDDIELARTALQEVAPDVAVEVVRDGVQLLAYLERAAGAGRLPDLVLLDLRMPRMDGLEALRQVRGTLGLRPLPIVTMFTTANDPAQVTAAYEAGANAYVTKPSSYAQLLRILRAITHHWFEIATLPTGRGADRIGDPPPRGG